MIIAAQNIDLLREKQEFQANIAIVQGKLTDLFLHIEELHPKEKIYYHTLKNDRRKKSYLLGRLAAKHSLMNLTAVQDAASIWIDSGVFEFPVVRCGAIHNIQTSISHCDSVGMSVAFEESHPIGIDVEKVRLDNKSVLLSQITDNEKMLLKKIGLDTIVGYTVMWCIKESLSKVIKTGMMIDFSLLEIDSIVMENNKFESTFSHFGQYKAISCSNEHHVLSLTIPRKTNIDCNQLRELFGFLKVSK